MPFRLFPSRVAQRMFSTTMRYSYAVALLAVATFLICSEADANVRYVGNITDSSGAALDPNNPLGHPPTDTGAELAGEDIIIGNDAPGGIFIDFQASIDNPPFFQALPVDTDTAVLGFTLDGVGRVDVADNSWTLNDGAADALIVGEDGLGFLDITTSGLVDVDTGGTVIGNGLVGQGQVTVGSIASRLRTNDLVVGNAGVGSIDVTFTGSIVSVDSALGAMSSGHGTVTLNDTSRWDLRGTLDVGFAGAPGTNGHGIINLNGNSLLQASVGTSALTINPSGFVNFGGGMFRNTQGNAITNNGVMRGDGTIDSDLDIGPGGELRNSAALADQREKFVVTGVVTVAGNDTQVLDPNDGLIESIGGEMEFLDLVENNGFIVARDAIMRFRGVEVSGATTDLDLDGALVIGGNTTIYGDIDASLGAVGPGGFTSAGNFIVLNGSTAEIYGDVIFNTAPLVAAITGGGVAAITQENSNGGLEFGIGDDPGSLEIFGELLLDGNALIELDYESSTPSQPGETFQLLSAQTISGTPGNSTAVADGRFWDIDVLGDEILVTATALTVGTADFNSDGRVDGLDFLTWQTGYPSLYDLDDLARWEAAYGESTTPPPVATVAAVPEPSSWLLALSTMGICSRRRQRN